MLNIMLDHWQRTQVGTGTGTSSSTLSSKILILKLNLERYNKIKRHRLEFLSMTFKPVFVLAYLSPRTLFHSQHLSYIHIHQIFFGQHWRLSNSFTLLSFPILRVLCCRRRFNERNWKILSKLFSIPIFKILFLISFQGPKSEWEPKSKKCLREII